MNSNSWGEGTTLAWAMVLGVPHLLKEEFPVLLDMNLKEERKLNLATGLCDLLDWGLGGGAQRRGCRAVWNMKAPWQEGRHPTPVDLRSPSHSPHSSMFL